MGADIKIEKFSKDFLWLHLRDLPYFRAILRSVEAHFYQEYELDRPILDVGCGDGHFASIVFDRPLDVGLDPWEGPLGRAAGYGGYVSLVQGDGGKMPFPEAFFASAISNSVLEHIPHVRQVLKETARVLQPGAYFIFSVPNPGYLSELAVPNWFQRIRLNSFGEAYRRWFQRMSRVSHAEPPEVWEYWLKEAGFSLERWFHYFPPEALRVLEWGHYLGAPTLLPHALTGRWILAPRRWNLGLVQKMIERFARPEPAVDGTFTFYVARRIRTDA